MLIGYVLSIVCLKLNRFFFLIYRLCNIWGCIPIRGLHVSSLPISLGIIVRIRVLHLIIIIKSEVWPICDCVGLGHETIVCVKCPSMFLCSFYCHLQAQFQDRGLRRRRDKLSKLELSQLHTHTSKVCHNIHQVFGMLPMSDSNWRKAVVSPIV